MALAPFAFLKWPGGKQALAETLVRGFPGHFRRYFEPFLGGGSLFFRVAPGSSLLSDANAWLIDTYAAIREDWSRVAGLLDEMPNNREDFLRIRSISPVSLDRWQRAANLIYLNKTCFRGLYRVNRHARSMCPMANMTVATTTRLAWPRPRMRSREQNCGTAELRFRDRIGRGDRRRLCVPRPALLQGRRILGLQPIHRFAVSGV